MYDLSFLLFVVTVIYIHISWIVLLTFDIY